MNDNQKAAAILRQYAGELYQGHTIGGEWPEDSARIEREHDDLMALADRLAFADAGEPVAYAAMVRATPQDFAVGVALNEQTVEDMRAGAGAHYVALLYTHPAPGRVAKLEAQCNHLAFALAERTEQLAEAREEVERLREALPRIADSLRKAGASLPAPENKGTVESAMQTGLSIALLLVEDELAALSASGREGE